MTFKNGFVNIMSKLSIAVVLYDRLLEQNTVTAITVILLQINQSDHTSLYLPVMLIER